VGSAGAYGPRRGCKVRPWRRHRSDRHDFAWPRWQPRSDADTHSPLPLQAWDRHPGPARRGFVGPPYCPSSVLSAEQVRSFSLNMPNARRGGGPGARRGIGFLTWRRNNIMVKLSDRELTRLDELRPSGTPRATFLRSLLQQPSSDNEIATRSEALAILIRLARDGRTTAAIALERALRDYRGATTLTTSFRGCSTTNRGQPRPAAAPHARAGRRGRPVPYFPCNQEQSAIPDGLSRYGAPRR
jgi:hypothetical protein